MHFGVEAGKQMSGRQKSLVIACVYCGWSAGTSHPASTLLNFSTKIFDAQRLLTVSYSVFVYCDLNVRTSLQMVQMQIVSLTLIDGCLVPSFLDSGNQRQPEDETEHNDVRCQKDIVWTRSVFGTLDDH